MNPNPQTPDELAKAVRDALESLKQRRPIFHSEGDLRHELGWELTQLGLQNVRAEKPFQDEQVGKGRVDLAADGFVAELKYFTTTNLEKTVDGEKFVVAGAPHRRGSHYTFWEDVCRVGRLVATGGLDFGCVVCVSNYPSMWDESRMLYSDSWLSDFWMGDGKTFPRRLKLGIGKPTTKKWAARGDICLLREHTLKWEEWHNFPDMKDGRFRYVVVEVRP